jgi:hypothetical protein
MRNKLIFGLSFIPIFLACCLALAANKPPENTLLACENIVDASLNLDDSMRWRLRAYNNLDCVVGLLDKALHSPEAASANVVPVSRDDLLRMKELALWAKDAAARIGR